MTEKQNYDDGSQKWRMGLVPGQLLDFHERMFNVAHRQKYDDALVLVYNEEETKRHFPLEFADRESR